MLTRMIIIILQYGFDTVVLSNFSGERTEQLGSLPDYFTYGVLKVQ